MSEIDMPEDPWANSDDGEQLLVALVLASSRSVKDMATAFRALDERDLKSIVLSRVLSLMEIAREQQVQRKAPPRRWPRRMQESAAEGWTAACENWRRG